MMRNHNGHAITANEVAPPVGDSELSCREGSPGRESRCCHRRPANSPTSTDVRAAHAVARLAKRIGEDTSKTFTKTEMKAHNYRYIVVSTTIVVDSMRKLIIHRGKKKTGNGEKRKPSPQCPLNTLFCQLTPERGALIRAKLVNVRSNPRPAARSRGPAGPGRGPRCRVAAPDRTAPGRADGDGDSAQQRSGAARKKPRGNAAGKQVELPRGVF